MANAKEDKAPVPPAAAPMSDRDVLEAVLARLAETDKKADMHTKATTVLIQESRAAIAAANERADEATARLELIQKQTNAVSTQLSMKESSEKLGESEKLVLDLMKAMIPMVAADATAVDAGKRLITLAAQASMI